MSGKSFKHKRITFARREPIPQKEAENEAQSQISYLQPEILPLETMKNLLRTRGASEEFLKKGVGSFIRKLFYKHITPKPQREYRENRIGKILLKLRKKREKSNKSNGDWEHMVSFSKSSSIGKSSSTILDKPNKTKSSNNMSSSAVDAPVERLKAPISSCIDPDRKKIKLSSSSSLDNIKINTIKRKNEDKESATNVKKLKLEDSVTQKTNDEIKVIKVIKVSKKTSKRESESKISEEKMRKPISWP